MVTTCGLRNVGPPGRDNDAVLESEWGLHGRIGHQCVENLWCHSLILESSIVTAIIEKLLGAEKVKS